MKQDYERYFNNEQIIKNAEDALMTAPVHITDEKSPICTEHPHCYCSFGDYWWKNPDTDDGLPYVKRDGESNPDNFNFHRLTLRRMRTSVSRLAIAYRLFGDERYATHATRMLREFFLDRDTYMEPHLLYAQGIPGVCLGRGIGIIDTLHLTELPFAIDALRGSAAMTDNIYGGLREWFSDYLDWITTHPYGLAEKNEPNNHGICWHVQALSFAKFVDRQSVIDECIDRYRTVILPMQMRLDGAFPLELQRTKPYNYSIFALDNTVTIVHLAALCGEDLWSFALRDGRSIQTGLNFMLPFLENKSNWPLPPDIEHFDELPARASFMLFSGLHYRDERYLKLYESLAADTPDAEIRRNLAIREPLLMLPSLPISSGR